MQISILKIRFEQYVESTYIAVCDIQTIRHV